MQTITYDPESFNVHRQIDEDVAKHHLTDMDAFVIWSLGRWAWNAARSVGASFPHDDTRPSPKQPPLADPRWIPVKERLPERADVGEHGEVLVWLGGILGFAATADCDWDKTWTNMSTYEPLDNVTHWMPLPKPPQAPPPTSHL